MIMKSIILLRLCYLTVMLLKLYYNLKKKRENNDRRLLCCEQILCFFFYFLSINSLQTVTPDYNRIRIGCIK